MKTLPVIILNWNGLNDTIECVDSVLNQTFSDYKVFLVDNASQNNEFEKLKQQYNENPKIELIRNSSNKGFGIAHNILFNTLIKTGYRFVALLNNDAVADKSWMDEAVKVLKSKNADIVACKMIQYYNRRQLDSAGLKMLNTGELLPRGHSQSITFFHNAEEVISFCAGACLIRLSLIEEIGGFDPFFDTGYEDAELGLRAFISGKKIVYSPRSVVYHKMGQSLGKVKSYCRTLKIQRDVNYTTLKLLPASILFLNFPFYILRSIFIVLVFILSLRFHYLFVFFHALYSTLTIDFKTIIKERKKVLMKISQIKLIKSQEFFVKQDFLRFYNYIINRKPHKFEQ